MLRILIMKKNTTSEFFLPDFCQVQSVFMVVLIGELLSVIFTFLKVQLNENAWQMFGLFSISIQFISLSTVAFLCLLRPSLAKLNDINAGLISLFIILLSTFFYSYVVLEVYYGVYFNLTMPAQQQFLIKNFVISGLIGAVILRYFYLQQQYRKQLQLETSARLEALQARIRPHFLFNSMNVIASLTSIDAKKAETAIEDLSDLIRATLDTSSELIPLNTELENGKKYLSIEALRLADRLTIDWQVDKSCLSVLVPPLSVQPLLENAVYHGIQMLPEGGTVSIHIKRINEAVIIEVLNPKLAKSQHKGHGIALNNISQRLEVIFKGKASLLIEELESSYKVSMQIPEKLSL